ncbi:pentapeptide repeat-containing protein [Dehalobacter sp. 4CP]|uniref:pentapeptide repeat-containing protein n=1 Tax=Dehalobacter sp. CP TaxID=2594474 RepID=UPI0039EBDFD5
MANCEHVKMLKTQVNIWNKWKKENVDISVDLSNAKFSMADLNGVDLSNADLTMADFSGADLNNANLRNANLSMADFSGANLCEVDLSLADIRNADLRGVDLSRANLGGADLRGADLSEANLGLTDLSGADLSGVDLSGTNFSSAALIGANLSGTDLQYCQLIEAILINSNLSNCKVYGVSVWDIKIDNMTKQNDLVITRDYEPIITVDNLEVAQFIYLMLNNKNIRSVINTISNKAVLILGKFGSRLNNLNAIREKLRELGYLPILFDFEKPSEKDTAETIITLAGMARFVIADLTEPRSIPLELKTIVSNLPTLPVQLLLQKGEDTFGMIDHILNFNSISGITRYTTIDELLKNFQNSVIVPLEEWKHLNKSLIEAKLKLLLD